MNDYYSLTIILVLGILFGLFAKASIENMVKHINKIKLQLENNKKYKAKEAKVALMKANGDFHEWCEIPDGAGGNVLVCAKTGWCPKLQGFIPMEKINEMLEDIRVATEYKLFRNQSVQMLAEKYTMTKEQMEKIVESVFDIKKQFHLKRLKDLADSMKKRASDVEQGNKI